ncbi:MAG: FecR domain-containing protein [Acidobacteria bacterium]|nr:FecR domain-containing protein [Acidobacteriota bacterium]
MTEDRFDELLKEMREETATAEQVAESRDRVWRKLAGRASALCSEFRSQLEDYLAGQLTEARRLLLEDHLSRCAECRRVFAGAATWQPGRPLVVPVPKIRRALRPAWTKWAAAAAIAALALYLGRNQIDSALAPGGARATVLAVSGSLYRVPQGVLHSGASLEEGNVVRTASGARAVLKLMDGSLVEVNQRTEISLHAAWSGQSVRLERGDIIVQAAKQRRGHLRVVTRDSVASVKGTIFAVSSGSAGSLVSVVEGRVAVSQPGMERVIERGGQAASNPALASVPLQDAVSWSENARKYYALLAEFRSIEKELADAPEPALRTRPTLVRYMPSGAFVYAAVPNLSGTIRDAVRLVEQRARESAVLNEWWTSTAGQELKKLLDPFQAVTPLLGEEVVFVLARQPANPGNEVPLILAEIQAGRRAAIEQALNNITKDSGHPFYYSLSDDLVLISESAAQLTIAQSLLGGGAATPFAAEIAQRYEHGVGWLAGIDVATAAVGVKQHIGSSEQVEMLGVPSMRYLFFEQRSLRGTHDNEATLAFQGARTGISSWLAAPGPAGSAEYISSDAVLALSASTRNPRQAFDELLEMLGQGTSRLGAELRRFESETGVNVGNDIAAALGTDFTLVIERPAIPIPAWVGVAEVLQPALLESAIRRLVESGNRKSPAQHQLTLGEENVGGRTWRTLKSASQTTTLSWTYDRGYLVAGTDRAVAARAIATRENGTPVIRSASFRQQLPGSGSVHHSGFIWINAQGALRDLSALVENPSLKMLLENRNPVLIVLDGETERIHAASRTRLTSLLLDLMTAAGPGPTRPGEAREHSVERRLRPRRLVER